MERLKKSIITKVVIDQNTGCWNFTGCIQSNGYGRITYKRQTKGAPRWSYMAFIGEIPDGMDVCHRCDNRKCVNPAHLFIGSRLDNMRDAASKDRIAKGLDLPQAKLSDQQKEQLLQLARDGVRYFVIAELFSMTPQSVGKIAIKHGIRRYKANGTRNQ